MTKLEQHRKTWQGKSDEWLFERLALELTQKVEEIHKLLAENEQLRLYNVSQQRELLKAFYKEIEGDYLYPEEVDMHVDDFLESL